MAILKIPTPLRYYTDGRAEVAVSGSNVAAVMRDLVGQYPALETHLYNGRGELRAFVNLFLDEDNIKDLQGMETPLGEEDTLRLIPSIAGGNQDLWGIGRAANRISGFNLFPRHFMVKNESLCILISHTKKFYGIRVTC
jgi:adenylyltransferase/sulfurtransferase